MGRLHTLLLQTLAGLHYRRKYCRLFYLRLWQIPRAEQSEDCLKREVLIHNRHTCEMVCNCAELPGLPEDALFLQQCNI